ncbi:sterol desaturase family protein [Montanilutibacter psychrotolerans]|nr:sterol desaturase family protein [Lysobacter psychrotolerans]
MKWLISRTLLGAVVVGNVALFLLARQSGWNLELVVLLGTLGTLVLACGLEHVLPHDGRWGGLRKDTATDLASAAIIVAIVDPALKYGGPLVAVWGWQLFGWSTPLGDWLTTQPYVPQLLAVIVLSELGRYWAHRWHHTHGWLWKLHALHHSSERLYALNNFRFHPLNYLNNFLLGVFPLLLLGVPSDVLLGYLAVSQPVLMLQHANLDLRSGWLNYLFSTNEVHRWHHSTVPAEANRNYGYALVLWDHVFGTFHYAPSRNAPRRIGLFAQSAGFPAHAGYLAQLADAFRPGCCELRK